MSPTEEESPLANDAVVSVLTVVYLLLLIPWIPMFFLSGMAFDGGRHLRASLFVGSVWIYPISVYLACKFREREPGLILLPAFNLFVAFVLG